VIFKTVGTIVTIDELAKGETQNLGNSYGEIIHDDDIRGMNHAMPKGGPQPENEKEPGAWHSRHTQQDPPDVNNPSPVPASMFYSRKKDKGEEDRTLAAVGDPREDKPDEDVQDLGDPMIQRSLRHVIKKKALTAGYARPVSSGGGVFRQEDLEKVPKKVLYVLTKKDFEKAVFTKDQTKQVKAAPKPGKSNARGTDAKGRKRYDYSASGGQKAKLTPGKKGAKANPKAAPAKPVQHPGQHYVEQLATLTHTSPDAVCRMARKFANSDAFLRYCKANFGDFTSKHGIQSHHFHHIFDASQIGKSDRPLVVFTKEHFHAG
jgi:hypothetical protein